MKLLIFTQKVDEKDSILGFFVSWIKQFAEHYDKVYVVCLEKGEYSLPDNVKVMSLGKEKGVSTFTYLMRFYGCVIPFVFGKKINRIFVHMNEVYVLLLAPFLPLRKLLGIQLDWWKCHGHISCKAKIGRFFVDRVLTCSPASFPVKTTKKKVLGHGIDTSLFIPGNSRENGVIISVGRMSKIKRYEDLIRATAHLKTFGEKPYVHIIGHTEADKQNRYFSMLSDTIKKLNVEECVVLDSAIENSKMVAIYQQADILVNTSDTDSLDKVVLEAMSCGVIPISSNLSYKPILSPLGLFVEKGDTEGLAKIIKRVLIMDNNEKDVLRKKMRNSIVVKHDLKELISKIVIL